MPYKKGVSGNLEGKPKGIKNRVTQEGRELFILIMKGQIKHIENNLDLLREDSPEKYLKTLGYFFAYFMPKQNDIEITLNRPTTTPTWFDEVLEREDQKDTLK